MLMLSNYREPALSWTSQWQPLQEEYRTVCAALQLKPNSHVLTYLTSLVESNQRQKKRNSSVSPPLADENSGSALTGTTTSVSSPAASPPSEGYYPDIHTLDFSSMFLGAKGALPLLAVIRRCTGLLSVNFDSVGITDYACTTICVDLASHPTLRIVSLSGNAITAESSDALKTLAHSWSMREITKAMSADRQQQKRGSGGAPPPPGVDTTTDRSTPLSIIIDKGSAGILDATVSSLKSIAIDETVTRKESPPLSTPLFMVSRPAVSLEKKKTASMNAPCPPKYKHITFAQEVKQMSRRIKIMECVRPLVPNRMVRLSADRWLVLSVFISSTFRDFPDEAALIHKVIFPRVNYRLRQFRIHLVPVMLHTANEEFYTHSATREADGPSVLDYTRLPPWRKHRRHFEEDRLGRRHGLMFNEEGAYSSEVRHLLIQGSCDAMIALHGDSFDPRVHPTDWHAAKHGLDHSVPTLVMRRRVSGVPAELAHMFDYQAALSDRLTAENINVGRRSFGALSMAEVRAQVDAEVEVFSAFQRQVSCDVPIDLICPYEASYQRVNHDGDVRFAVEESFITDMSMFLMSMAYTYFDKREKGQNEPKANIIDPTDAMKRDAVKIPVIQKQNWGDPKHLAKRPTFKKDISKLLVADIRTEQEIVRQKLNLPPPSDRLSLLRGSSVGGPETLIAAAEASKVASDKKTAVSTKLLINDNDADDEGVDGGADKSSSSMDTADLENDAGVDEDDSEEDEISVSRDVQETCFSCIQGPRGSGKTTQLRSIAAQISKDPLALVSSHRVIGAQTSLLSVMVGLLQQFYRRFDEGGGSVFGHFDLLPLFQEDVSVEAKEECLVDAFCSALFKAPTLRAELTRICIFIDDDDAITEVSNFGGVRKTFAELFLSKPHRIAKLQTLGVKRPGHCVVQVYFTSTLDQSEFHHEDDAQTPLTRPYMYPLLQHRDTSEQVSRFCPTDENNNSASSDDVAEELAPKEIIMPAIREGAIPPSTTIIPPPLPTPAATNTARKHLVGFTSDISSTNHAVAVGPPTSAPSAAMSQFSGVFGGSVMKTRTHHPYSGRALLTVVPVPTFSEFEAADLFYYLAIGTGEYAAYASSSLKARICEAAKLLVLNKPHATRPLYLYLAAREVAYYQESVPITAIVEAIPGTIEELAITAIKVALPPDLECVFEALGTAPEPLEGSVLRYAMRNHRMFPYFTQATSEKEWWCTPRTWGRLGNPVMCATGLLATVNANFVHLFQHNSRPSGQGFVVRRWNGVASNIWRSPWVVAHRTVAEALWKLYDPDRKVNTKSLFYSKKESSDDAPSSHVTNTHATLRTAKELDKVAAAPQGFLRTPASDVLWDRPLKRLSLLREGTPHVVRGTSLMCDPHALFGSPQRIYALLHDKGNDELLLAMVRAYGVLLEEHRVITEGVSARAPTTPPSTPSPSPEHTLATLKILRDCAIFFDKHWQTLLRHKLFWFTGIHQMPPTLQQLHETSHRANPNTSLRVGSRYSSTNPPSKAVLSITPHSVQECYGSTIRLGAAGTSSPPHAEASSSIINEGGMFGRVGASVGYGTTSTRPISSTQKHPEATRPESVAVSTTPQQGSFQQVARIKSFVVASKHSKRFAVVYESIDASCISPNDISPQMCDAATSALRRVDGQCPEGFGSFTVMLIVSSSSSSKISKSQVKSVSARPYAKAISGIEVMESPHGTRLVTAAYHEPTLHVYSLDFAGSGSRSSEPILVQLSSVKAQLQGLRAIVRGLSIAPFMSDVVDGRSVGLDDGPMVAYASRNALKVMEPCSRTSKPTPSTHTFTDAHEAQIVLTGFSPGGTKIFSVDDRANVFVWGAPKTPFSGNVLAVTEFPSVPTAAFFLDDDTIAYVHEKGVSTWNSSNSEVGPLIPAPSKNAPQPNSNPNALPQDASSASAGLPIPLGPNAHAFVFQEFAPAALAEKVSNPKSLVRDDFRSPVPAAVAVYDPKDKAVKLFTSTKYNNFLTSTSTSTASDTATESTGKSNTKKRVPWYGPTCSMSEYCVIQPYSSNTDTIGNHAMATWIWRFGLHHAAAIDTRENIVKVFDLRLRKQVPMNFGIAYEKGSVESTTHETNRLQKVAERRKAKRDRRVKELMEEEGFAEDDDMAELFDQNDVMDILALEDDDDDDEEEAAKVAALEAAGVGVDGEPLGPVVSGADALALKGPPVFIPIDDLGVLFSDDVGDDVRLQDGTTTNTSTKTSPPQGSSHYVVVADSRGYVHALALHDGPLTYPSNPLTTC